MGSNKSRLVANLKVALLAILGLLVGTTASTTAQEAKPKSLVRVGYTRPGSPEDPLKGGKMVPLAHNPDYKGKLIGATVYFAVLERVGAEGDYWGSGMADLDGRFLLGKDLKNNFSPRLDTKARYLYLYQIVNDRGLDPMEVMPQENRAGDIGGFGLKLPVDPKNITSWGHFKNSSFSVVVPEQAAGEIQPAAQGKTENIRLAVSAASSILNRLPERRYLEKSPTYSFPDLRSSIGISSATMNLKESSGFQALLKKKAKGVGLVGFEDNFLKAADAAREPEFVQILSKTEKNEAEFHALWKDSGVIKLGQHSVLVGFTSDLAPTNDQGQIESADALKGGAVRPVAAEGEVAQATLPVPQAGVQAAAATKARTPVRSGYTKPGNPPDELTRDGKIRPIAYRGGSAQKIIGGTVYFSVFERVGLAADGDPWGTGMGNLQETFTEGYSFQGSYSPHLDTRGRYLYLYQIVNDRGLDRADAIAGVAPAADDRKDLNTVDIAGYALRLSVDPRYITSWGSFKDAAFTATVPNRNLGGDIVPAADGGDSKIALAVSSYQPILSDIPVKRYTNRSPAFPLPGDMVSSWGVGPGTLNLKLVEDHKQLSRLQSEGIKLVGFEKNKLNAANAAKRPDFVQIMYGQADDRTTTITDNMGEIGPVVFRADFRNPLKPGEHSVVFGFTTDLPPQDEPLRIEEQLPIPGGIRAVVGGGDGLGTGVGTGTGIVPAAGAGVAPGPVPAAPQAAGGVTGSLGGMAAGGMGGGGGMPTGGLAGGGLGGARPAGTGGGGGGIVGGGGRGNSNGNPNENQNQNSKGTINFNANLINQQQQQQQQTGGGCCCCNGGGNVVPEPGSVLLALLGAPGAFWLWRRKNAPAA